MKTVSILSILGIAGMVAAKFVVIDKPVHARKAADVCERKGYRLAKLKGGKHSNLKAATKALYKAKVGEAWIAKLDGKSHHKVLYLAKPANFKNDREAGDVFRAQCDGDDVCNELRAVLCDDGEKKKKKSKKGKKHSRSSRRHGRRRHNSSSSSSSSGYGYYAPQEEYYVQESYSPKQSYSYGDNYDTKKPYY